MKNFHCETCDITMPKANKDTHLAGKKHKKALELLNSKCRRLEVTGYTKTNMSVIQMYFSQFGQVDSVVIHPKMNKAVVVFTESHSCDVALSCPEHVMNDEKVQVSEPEQLPKVAKKTKAQKASASSNEASTANTSTVANESRNKTEQIHCELCNLTVTSEIRYKSHLFSNQHKELECKSRSIYVSQFCNMTHNNLTAYFSQFGLVQGVKLFPQYADASVAFTDQKGRDAALAVKHHYHQGQPFRVAMPTTKSKTEWLQLLTKDSEKERRERTLICRNVVSSPTLASQVSTLRSHLEMPSGMVKERLDFLAELQVELRRFIPEVKFEVYGSTATGLGSKFSDLDISLDMDTSVNRQGVNILPSPLPDLRDFPGFKVDRGLVTLDSIINGSNEQVLSFFITCIKASNVSRSIYHYRPISNARVPVLKLKHDPIGKCDITFGARLSVHNTHLLQLLSKVDARFPILTRVVRFWAHQVGVVSDDYNNSLTNYALTLLVYFFLENTKPPILPTVQGLADIVSLDNNYQTMNVLGWDCGISEDLTSIHRLLLPNRNKQPLEEVVKGFFDFYANFDMHNNVICPRSGKSINVMTFRVQMEKDKRLQNFVVKDLMVQDPFELSHNTCGHISDNAARGIITQEFIKAAVKINHCPSWTLKTFIPIGTFLSPPPPPPRSTPVTISFQLHRLPKAFNSYGSLSNIEEQWHQWVVDIAFKVLGILEMETVVADSWDSESDLFPDNANRSPKSPEVSSFIDVSDDADEESAESIRSHSNTSYSSYSTDSESHDSSDVIVVSDDSDVEVVDVFEPSIFEAPKSPQCPSSSLPSKKCEIKEATHMKTDKPERQDDESSLFDPPGSPLYPSASLCHSKEPEKHEANDGHSNSESSKTQSRPSSSWSPTSDKRKQNFTDHKPKKKKRKPVEPDLKVEEYKHHSLNFNLEKCTKAQTYIRCRTYCNAWEERQPVRGLRRSDFDGSFSYHKAVAAAVLKANGGKTSSNVMLQFVLRIHRYTYGHSTKIELVPQKHGIPLPNKFVYKLKSLLHEIISTTIEN